MGKKVFSFWGSPFRVNAKVLKTIHNAPFYLVPHCCYDFYFLLSFLLIYLFFCQSLTPPCTFMHQSLYMLFAFLWTQFPRYLQGSYLLCSHFAQPPTSLALPSLFFNLFSSIALTTFLSDYIPILLFLLYTYFSILKWGLRFVSVLFIADIVLIAQYQLNSRHLWSRCWMNEYMYTGIWILRLEYFAFSSLFHYSEKLQYSHQGIFS